ncbi:MAG: helix-turn-helix domain-containing protein [Woeseiaceae bacterium]|nr:helix-turn-helix domain-containing protein [Woeseiaceae bacterium]
MGTNKEVDFYNRIRLLRTERSVSRKELADAVGVHPQTIGYIERRQYNLSLALALKLAAYFGLTLDAVFSPEPFEPLSNEVLKRG